MSLRESLETRAQDELIRSKPRQNRPVQTKDDPEVATVPFFERDVPKAFVNAARKYGAVAWDIETSGLDWRSERIGLCQLLVKEQGLSIVKIKKNNKPSNL